MIKEKAIHFKLNQLQFSDQQIFDAAVAEFKPQHCSCPKCNAKGSLIKFQPYQRQMISVENGSRKEVTLTVPRFLCDSCGHTHALLPDILIPYGSYSIRFVLTLLQAYLSRTCSVADLCDQWQISVSTLYGWIHLFLDHFNAWCDVLDRIRWVCSNAIEQVCSTPHLPADFLARFGFSFLQARNMTLSDSRPQQDRRHRPRLT